MFPPLESHFTLLPIRVRTFKGKDFEGGKEIDLPGCIQTRCKHVVHFCCENMVIVQVIGLSNNILDSVQCYHQLESSDYRTGKTWVFVKIESQ